MDMDYDRQGRPGWYRTWINIILRCTCVRHDSYPNYGGRGIKVCSAWHHNPEEFGRWALSHGWRPGLLIDRIDNDGDYTPENCRWVTPTWSNRHRTCCRFITYHGLTGTLSQWAAFAGLRPGALRDRLERGWTMDDALRTPAGGKRGQA